MTTTKPTLYTFTESIWGASAEIAIAELGYGSDAIEQKQLVLLEAQNLKPDFLKINPEGTLPTLVADGNTYTSTKDVVKYLISNAPDASPDLSGSDAFIDLVHEPDVDPNFILFASRNDAELARNSGLGKLWFGNRAKIIAEYEQNHSELKDFYTNKKNKETPLFELFLGKPGTEEFKQQFFAISTKHWQNINRFIDVELNKVLPEAGFIHGSRPGEGDFHLAAWLARIVHCVGGKDDKNGADALEKTLGHAPSDRVKAYWQAWVERPSWNVVYGSAGH